MNGLSEQIQEVMDLVTVAMEDTDDESILDDLETAIEILEDVEHKLGMEQEMDEMMGKHRDNMEDLDEI
ncbi:MAG: hypothetical protein ABEK50_13700 [bacterium]